MPDGANFEERNNGDHPSVQWPTWMAHAQAGDQVAYARLLKALVPPIRRLVQRQIADEQLVEDVIQEVLLAIHRVRHTYDPDRPLLPWVAAIASARAIDALRSRGRRLAQEVCDEEAMLEQGHAPMARHLDGLAARQEVDGLLERLPERQRRVVELVHLNEMSLSEAAAATSSTLSSVKALLHRAFTTLRRAGSTDHDRP